ncbi:MAG TPA: MFS transporter [Magnetovibrio sp.]
MNTLTFLLHNRRFLGFGLACTLASNFGQTFFIALFNSHLREAFNLGHADFGALYATATLASAVVILWAGRLIDRVDLRLFAAAVLVGLALSAAIVAGAQGIVMLGVGLMGLRLFGQGLMRHTAVVSQARYFEAARGRAMSVVGLGYPIAEATFPALLIVILAAMTWREAWGWMAAYILCVHLPLVLWLLKGHGERHRALEEKLARDATVPQSLDSRTIAQDWRFQLILPASLMGPFMMTGLFFHQLAIAESKGWTMELLAASFPAFAIATVVSSLVTGALVDRLGPGRVLPVFVWPLVAALVVVAFITQPLAAPLYLALGGLTTGASTVLISAAWAETFGVRHLGKVRSLTSSLTVLATAIAPVWAGWLLDGGWSVKAIAIGAVGIVIAAGLAVQVPARELRRLHNAKFP